MQPGRHAKYLFRVVLDWIYFFFSFRGRFTETRKNAVGPITAWYHGSGGCNARPSDRIAETSGARVGLPLDRATTDAPTPRESIMPRRTSRAQLLARQSPHDINIAGDSVLISAMSVSRLRRLDG